MRVTNWFRKRDDWRSWRQSIWWMTIIVFLESLFIITIGVLVWWSNNKDGFSISNNSPITSFGDVSTHSVWESQLLWTLVPAIVLALFSLGYASTVSATAERQPYVELYSTEENAKNANLTILLDYQSKAIFYSWWIAWLNGHVLLGCAILLQLVASIIIVPLANNLFRTNDAIHPEPLELSSSLLFDISTLESNSGERLGFDLIPAIQVAGAVHVYGAALPPWITTKYAVERLSAVDGGVVGNINVNTTVYYSKLDCQSIPRTSMKINLDATGGIDGFESNLISFEDRGCNIQDQTISFTPSTLTYSRSWFQRCFGLQAWKDRIGVFIASYSDDDLNKLGNLVAVSCIPSYHNATADVGLRLAIDGTAQIQTVDVIDSSAMKYEEFRFLQDNIHVYEISDPSGAIEADAFGQTVYDYAIRLSNDGGAESDADLVLKSMQTI